MPDTGNRVPQAPNDTTEQKMRRALGLNASTKGGGHTPQQRPEQARARHRFVQDGGVPVTVLNPRHEGESGALKERIGELEHQLDLERNHHAGTRRTLQELQASHQALETRLVHADLAHQDAITQERQLRMAAQEALAATQAPAPQRRTREAAPERQATKPEPDMPASEADAAPAETAAMPPAALTQAATPLATMPKKRGRPRSALPKEPKPVRWWTPSFKAKTKA